jgi:hypothetical protein
LLGVSFDQLGEILFEPEWSFYGDDKFFEDDLEWEIGNDILSLNPLAIKKLSKPRQYTGYGNSYSSARSRIHKWVKGNFSSALLKLKPFSSRHGTVHDLMGRLDEFLVSIPLKDNENTPSPLEANLYYEQRRFKVIAALINWRLSFEITELTKNLELTEEESKHFPLCLVERRKKLLEAIEESNSQFTDEDVRKVIRQRLQ